MLKTVFILMVVTYTPDGVSALRVADQFATYEACATQEITLELASPIIFAKCSPKKVRID